MTVAACRAGKPSAGRAAYQLTRRPKRNWRSSIPSRARLDVLDIVANPPGSWIVPFETLIAGTSLSGFAEWVVLANPGPSQGKVSSKVPTFRSLTCALTLLADPISSLSKARA